MIRKNVKTEIYDGLSVNERLALSGKLDLFGAAAKIGNRKRMISMLERLAISKSYATRWVDTLLTDQKFLYF